ncbi:hypothetical protein CAPN001_23890 [Capnocytophaga stomatis]|uniref:hypothetical protein n=1 Tax=Capnocytophaga stomatis TaxID=1848904 RepID=UPI001950BB9C|nr:hypothetical protein [Capnocytophaga stomatis]GIJ97820.1 hypothetical protein CAPN001_23890 [Capnocytophaga stomatis]
MIDGVKIIVPCGLATLWLNNPRLQFCTYTGVNTGEVLGNSVVAKYKGLKFFIRTHSETGKATQCEIQGSLHKYFNAGKHNANDFNFNDLQAVISDLNEKFNVQPETAYLQNIEFGVNVLTPITANEILKNVVAYKNEAFISLYVEKKEVGKQILQQRQRLKIYDKGKQYKRPEKNLTRFEIAVKKMEALKAYNIKTLSDLTQSEKISPLISLLLDWWSNTIYYDKSINLKHLSDFQQKKVLYYATPRNWQEFNRMQRTRAKAHLQKLMNAYGSKVQTEIGTIISEKWQELSAEKCIRFNHVSEDTSQQGNVYDLTVRIHGYNVYNSIEKTDNKKSPKKARKLNAFSKGAKPKKRGCLVCGKDISHKQTNAKYCSKKCNNKHNGKMRTKKRQKQRENERHELSKLLPQLAKNNFLLNVTYKTQTGEFSDLLQQSDITAPPEWIRKVTRVFINPKGKTQTPIILTGYRARKFIKVVNKLNIIKQ